MGCETALTVVEKMPILVDASTQMGSTNMSVGSQASPYWGESSSQLGNDEEALIPRWVADAAWKVVERTPILANASTQVESSSVSVGSQASPYWGEMSTQTVTRTADVATLASPSCKEGGTQTVASFSPTGVACQLVTEDDRAVRHTFTPEDVRWQLIARQRLTDSHGEDYGEDLDPRQWEADSLGEDYGEDLDPRQWEEEDRSHWEEGGNNWASHMWETPSPSAFVDDLDRYFATSGHCQRRYPRAP